MNRAHVQLTIDEDSDPVIIGFDNGETADPHFGDKANRIECIIKSNKMVLFEIDQIDYDGIFLRVMSRWLKYRPNEVLRIKVENQNMRQVYSVVFEGKCVFV